MRNEFRISSLAPSGLVFQSVSDSTDSIISLVRSGVAAAECPLCGTASRRIQSVLLERRRSTISRQRGAAQTGHSTVCL